MFCITYVSWGGGVGLNALEERILTAGHNEAEEEHPDVSVVTG